MLNLSSVPFLLSTRTMQNSVANIRKSFQTAQTEAVTGRVANISDALDGDVGRVHRMEKLISLAERRRDTLSAAQSEFSFVQMTLGSARSKAADIAIHVDGALGLDDEISLEAYAVEARAELASVFGQLNTSHAGKHLFSGAAVDTSPLGDVNTLISDVETIISGAATAGAAATALDTYFGAGGGFETTIYQGSTSAGPTREVAEGRRVGVDVTALDPGVVGVIRGLVVTAVARSSASDKTIADGVLANAVDTLNTAAQTVTLTQARLGSVEKDLALLESRNEAARSTYELNLNKLIGRDQYEAATEMTNLETQLEAAYLATSKIANLTLANYLR